MKILEIIGALIFFIFAVVVIAIWICLPLYYIEKDKELKDSDNNVKNKR